MVTRHILVLEMNEKIRTTIMSAAKKAGFAYHALKQSENLFRYLNKHPVDVLLVNARQQGTGPRSVCSLIRNDPQYRRFPLIILYGKQGKVSRLDYLKQGADDFVAMPFSPAQLMGIVKARLRPLADQTAQALSNIDRVIQPGKSKFAIPPLDEKGSLEFVPPAAILARLFLYRESGILDLIIRKETRTLYFKNGDLIYAETMSRKDDIADYLARNRASKGSGKELVAARAQSGGPKSDPNVYATILKESRLMDPTDFAWWLRMYQVDMVANLFVKPHGVFQWQSLDIPEYATQTTLEAFSTPRIIFQGIRVMKDRWGHRELLPDMTSVPSLATDFYERGKEYGLNAREMAIMKVVNGRRTLQEIGEICHLVAPQIDNYLYACQQLQLIAFDVESDEAETEDVDVNEILEIPDEAVDHDALIRDSETVASPDREKAAAPADNETIRQQQVRGASDGAADEVSPQESTARAESADARPVLQPQVFEFSLSSGSLEETFILETFRQAIIHSFTGQLKYENQNIEKSVFWKRGTIVLATSNDIDERLDNFLFRKDLITSEQRDQLRTNPPELIGSPNELIKRKFLTIDKVFVVVKEQIEAILAELITWRKGQYTCLPDANTPRDMVPLDLSAQAILMSTLHKPETAAVWDDKCPEMTDYYRTFSRGDNLRGVKLSPMERRIMNLLHEPLSVNEVVQNLDQPAREIRLSLFAMEMSGILERCRVG